MVGYLVDWLIDPLLTIADEERNKLILMMMKMYLNRNLRRRARYE